MRTVRVGGNKMDFAKSIEIWKAVFLNPVKFFGKAKYKSDLGTALQWAAIAGVIGAILNFVGLSLIGKSSATELIVSMVMMAILSPLMLAIVSGLFYIFAKLLKGKANYETQTYAMAAFQSPMSILMAIVNVVFNVIFPAETGAFGVPMRTGIAMSLYAVVILAIMAYGMYLFIVTFKAVHKYSTLRAALTFLLPAAILVGIFILFAMFFFATFAFSGPVSMSG